MILHDHTAQSGSLPRCASLSQVVRGWNWSDEGRKPLSSEVPAARSLQTTHVRGPRLRSGEPGDRGAGSRPGGEPGGGGAGAGWGGPQERVAPPLAADASGVGWCLVVRS